AQAQAGSPCYGSPLTCWGPVGGSSPLARARAGFHGPALAPSGPRRRRRRRPSQPRGHDTPLMTTSTVPAPTADPRIPFWRNVKTIGVIAQVAFVLLIVAGIGVLVNNVTTALARANLPADFSFLGQRAGIPIAETPIRYTVTDSYARALLIGFLNTLKVAVVG